MPDSEPPSIVFRASPLEAGLRSRVRRFANVLADRVAMGRSFDCLITRDDEIRRLNREFRGKDTATDVLSFPSGAAAGPLGDIAISSDRAAEQAKEHGHSQGEEICLLMLHGVLHLTGMDHERDRGKMRRVEREWRTELGLPEGLIERAGR